MIPMTTARAAAPNLGGRANTRGRAVVANQSSFPAEGSMQRTKPSGGVYVTHAGHTQPSYALPSAMARSAQPIAHHGVLPVDSQPLAFTPAIRQAGALCLTRGFLYAPVPSVCRVCQSAKNPLDLGPVDSGCGPVPKRGARFFAAPIHDANPAQVAHEHAGISCEVVIAARERLEPVAQWNGVTVGRDRRNFNAVLAEPNPLMRTHATKDSHQDRRGKQVTREKYARVVGYAQAIPARAAPFTAPPRTTTRMQPGNYGNGWRFFYAVSNAERTSHGCPVGYRDNDELLRDFNAGVKTLAGLAERIERVAGRHVRPVARKAAA